MIDRTDRELGDPFAATRRGVNVVLIVLLLAAGILSLATGAVPIDPAEVLGSVGGRVGVNVGVQPGTQADAVIWAIRLPRVTMGMVAGACLGIAGVVLQGAFRTRMADPQLLGIGPGASVGAVIGSAVGATQGAIAGGAAAGLLTALVVRRIGRNRAGTPTGFILSGVALSAVLSAWVGFAVFGSDRTKVPPLEFWLLGSLSGSTWRTVGTSAIIGGLAVVGLYAGARSLDLLWLGESDARRLGLDVEFVITMLLIGTGVAVGAVTGAVGVIGFAGLLVPHIVRRFTGPSHRPLMMGSMLGGAVFVVLADWGSRIAVPPVEIPVGLLTAALGGPFFLWLVGRGESP